MFLSLKNAKANAEGIFYRSMMLLLVCMAIAIIIPVGVKAAEAVSGEATVTADSLNVRSGPGKEFEAVSKVKKGDVLEASEIDGDWIKISYGGIEGYVAIEYVDFEPDEVEEVVEEDTTSEEAETTEDNETEDEKGGFADYKLVFILIGIMVVVMIMILITVKSLRDLDNDDDDDDDEDDYYEDEYDDDEEDDEYEDDEVDYEEDDEVDYEEDDDEYEYEHIVIRRPKESTKNSSEKTVKRSDDYSIDIDPRYFE